MKLFAIALSRFLFLFITSCSEERSSADTQPDVELPESGISITDAWARPGRVNGVTAVYLNVANGSAETDTLIAMSSPQAGLVELHETFEREEGMMGMREAEEPIFPGRSVVSMKPGGLHIMLMQLHEAINEGETLEITLEFALHGEETLRVPVQSPN